MNFLQPFLSWWGLLILGAIDATVAFVAPFGVDAALIYLVARDDGLFWLYPIMATSGSVAGAALTYWLGRRVGGAGLRHFVSESTLDRVHEKVRRRGALAIALPALLPPPFPLKPFILASGALEVDATRFFITFAAIRALRFGIEMALARRYGSSVLGMLESEQFQQVLTWLIITALAGTVVSVVILWRKSRRHVGAA